MIGYITPEEHDKIVTVPISLPQTEIRGLGIGDSLLLSSLQITLGQRIRLRWLGLHVPKPFFGTGPIIKANDDFGAVYLGLYSGGFGQLNRPSGKPLVVLNLDAPGTTQTNPYVYYDFSAPDLYSLLIVNNMSNYNVEAIVTGSFRAYL